MHYWAVSAPGLLLLSLEERFEVDRASRTGLKTRPCHRIETTSRAYGNRMFAQPIIMIGSISSAGTLRIWKIPLGDLDQENGAVFGSLAATVTVRTTS